MPCLCPAPRFSLIDSLVQGLVNFEGYYLDGEDVYAPKEATYQGFKLEDLEAEAKHTQNRTMVRLTSRFQIK